MYVFRDMPAKSGKAAKVAKAAAGGAAEAAVAAEPDKKRFDSLNEHKLPLTKKEDIDARMLSRTVTALFTVNKLSLIINASVCC